ncbi:HPr kinase/phosphatase C-terminal domain-containing protein [Pseudochrobactrum sp. sp1633]|uniref:HPr kinase/phosphorylase n=1 Tax=Pseudochrobactrum sp. sp1633 TaxID=3036706 RepID=UPI0025A62B88|nr:HPr kinase/phosphatase C-terminal domain-containing protein [Pseudochrobactrum sp. sp1633]MDM8344966.1 HPr kinase/phosphatase C-terminal domain-containing protein [Pseudochrobactrum sp. sp1633]HWD14798.1 HPr kinase/phosphatase C-terminal domain-containing protein [Pseudochrobactrum sp.]
MNNPEGFVFHATSLVLGSFGILLCGASGSGKSSLALTLIERAHQNGRVGMLISDDQTIISTENGNLIASAPDAIAGAVEIRGAGLFEVSYQPQAEINLLVELLTADKAPRYPTDEKRELVGLMLPVLTLPALAGDCDSLQCARAIEATLFMKRWGSSKSV